MAGVNRILKSRVQSRNERGDRATERRVFEASVLERASVSHAWKFQKPPLPAQYKLEDAIALEMSREKGRKGKHELH
jgi:hypothetical protein